jgi:hypothetical protein
MFTARKLRRKPHHFANFTGLTPEQFDELLAALRPVYERLDTEGKTRLGRQRAIGGGPSFRLALSERLLMTLIYFRLYTTQTLISYFFDCDDSTVSREINHRVLPALLDVLPTPMRDELGLIKAPPEEATPSPERSRKRIGTLAELLARHPEFEEVLLDATEQETPRPVEEHAKRLRYSGKQKRHTLKTQLVTTQGPKGVVLHISGHVPGRVSDLLLLRFSGVLHGVSDKATVRVDRGYEGVEEAYPDVRIEKPVKGRRAHRVTALGKAYNRMQNSLRVGVEHMIGRVKRFRLLSGLYRGPISRYDDGFAVCAGLVNFKALGGLSW